MNWRVSESRKKQSDQNDYPDFLKEKPKTSKNNEEDKQVER